VGDGSIDARAKRRLGNQTVEPRKGLLEELAGPAQFRPWVAGLWKFFCEVVKVNILLGWLQPNSFRA